MIKNVGEPMNVVVQLKCSLRVIVAFFADQTNYYFAGYSSDTFKNKIHYFFLFKTTLPPKHTSPEN